MEHIYIDNMDKLAGTGKYLLAIFQAPDGQTTVAFSLEEIEKHKPLIARQRLEFVGLCGSVNDSPQFVEQHPLPPNVRTAIRAHYRMHVEQKRAEALNATQIRPASEPTYSWDLKRYVH